MNTESLVCKAGKQRDRTNPHCDNHCYKKHKEILGVVMRTNKIKDKRSRPTGPGLNEQEHLRGYRNSTQEWDFFHQHGETVETDTLKSIHSKIFSLFDVSCGTLHLQLPNDITILIPDTDDSYIRFYQSNIMNLVPCPNSIYDKNCPRTFRVLLSDSPKPSRSPSSDNDSKDMGNCIDFMEYC